MKPTREHYIQMCCLVLSKTLLDSALISNSLSLVLHSMLINFHRYSGIFYEFLNEFNKFNNTGARMLDSIYLMTLELIKNHIFGVKTSRFCHLLRNVII